MDGPLLKDAALLEAMLANCPIGILLVDQSGSLCFANEFARSILEIETDCHHLLLAHFFIDTDRSIFLPNILKTTRAGGSFRGEAMLKSQGDRRLFVYLTTHLYHQRSGDYVIVFLQDISQQKALERTSQETNRILALGKVVDRIAHHIRNPVAAIGGFASRLLKGELSNEQRSLYQEIIFQEATRLDHLLKELANFTTLPLPVLSEQSVHELWGRAQQLLDSQKLIRASAWHLPPAAELDLLRGYMDLELMGQCLAQVLANALEAGTKVEISLQALVRDRSLELTVIDTGCGISPHDLPFVFDPLFTTKYDHVGLGLTISRRIVEDHGGSINIHSTLGRGTTVVLRLPQERRRPVRIRRL